MDDTGVYCPTPPTPSIRAIQYRFLTVKCELLPTKRDQNRQGKVDEEDITAVVKRFEALDGDGNGYVELHEIEAECAANTNGFVTMGDM